ncbi:helix-turn-helix domain-containing protein [Bremerella alba]|uniref:Helix-turn-helix domain-containing protein n=1 Tax=Bremerella alba TaxID=980252 RepID=A0A7V8V8C5_9BACT|nr:helix-turn-helix domain-containing protein [Bremerella alba]MBA2116834.1 hypothetical protein [Bremerella alba]
MLTVRKAASRLGVSYGFVLELIRSGKIEAINISEGKCQKSYRISPQSLDDFIQRNKVKSVS